MRVTDLIMESFHNIYMYQIIVLHLKLNTTLYVNYISLDLKEKKNFFKDTKVDWTWMSTWDPEDSSWSQDGLCKNGR